MLSGNTNVGAGFNKAYYSPITVGTVFYLGKSSSKTGSVFQRLKVHYGDRTDSATNGIKMRMPERSFAEKVHPAQSRVTFLISDHKQADSVL